MSASDGAPRVALLARAGEACDRIDSALREAGAEVVLVADPLQADPGDVRGASPEAILVALDVAIEDAIERYGDVLADPGYMVIFEEAEQVAQRTGWDAARWLRHLSAKLHRHDDVLPAGGEREQDLQPSPGPLPPSARTVDFDAAIASFTGEAQERADEVPRDSGLEGLTGRGEADDAVGAGAAQGFDAAVAVVPAPAEEAAPVATDLSLEDEALSLEDEALSLEALSLAPAGEDASIEPGDQDFADASSEVLLDESGEEITIELVLEDDGDEDPGLDELSFDPARFARAGEGGEASAGIEEFLATRIAETPAERDDGRAETPADAAEAGGEPVAAPAAPDLSGLSLVEDDIVVPAGGTAGGKPAFDLDGLGSGLSLADPDSYGHGKQQGAVLIEAGIGGPDAVRQLLAGIPEGFPKAILIHLPLEGGRYDRLVKQMTRATPLPVAVAEPGQRAQPGHVYFVPPGLGLKAAPPGWAFDDAVPFDATLLPADDSAVLFLSGANAALVAALAGAGRAGGLVFGQTPDEGCYDPTAAQAAIAAGAAHASPAALAARLLERWPAPGHEPPQDPDGMLSP